MEDQQKPNDTKSADTTDGLPARSDRRSEVRLSVPWGTHQQIIANGCRFDGELPTNEVTAAFIEARTRAHELFIREQERTKRISLILSFVLILSSALIMIYAPTGRETLSYWIGGALVIFAAGATGYKRIWGHSKLFSFRADQDRNDSDRNV